VRCERPAWEWTFGPTLAVVRDDRWGRTYESYSEDPQIVREYAGQMVTGLQGRLGSAQFLDSSHVIATAKHFVGDGGTGGRDQGDNRATELSCETFISRVIRLRWPRERRP